MAARPTTTAIVTRPRVTITPPKPTVVTTPRVTAKPTTPAPTVVRPPVTSPATTITTPRVPIPPTTATTTTIPTLPVTTTTSPTIPVIPPTTSSSITSSPTLPLTSPSPSTTTTSSAPSTTTTNAANPPNSGVSTGAVVGGIMGGFVALGVIGAILYLFLRRIREKREAHDRAFDATKFRQSAILLEDPTEKRRKPRPPTFLEQHVRNTPTPRADPYPPHPGPRYPQEHYGSPYAQPTTYPTHFGNPYAAQGQPQYNQYPPSSNSIYSDRGYGAYPMSQGYSPPTQYPPQPHQPQYYPQQNAYAPAPIPHPQLQQQQRPISSASDQTSSVLPNPFGNHSPSISETVPSSQYGSTTTSDREVRDVAPPAYEITGKSSFANYQPDQKGKITLTVTSDDDSSSSISGQMKKQGSLEGSTTSTSTSTSTSTVVNFNTTTDLNTGVSLASTLTVPVDRKLPSRPTSAQTVYDPADAYGGM